MGSMRLTQARRSLRNFGWWKFTLLLVAALPLPLSTAIAGDANSNQPPQVIGGFTYLDPTKSLLSHCTVEYDAAGAVTNIRKGFVTDEDLILIARLPRVTGLYFYAGPEITQRGMSALYMASNLVSLSMCAMFATNNMAAMVGRMGQLKSLRWDFGRLSDSDLRNLVQLTNLEELVLRPGSIVGPGAMCLLTNLTHLKRLDFSSGVRWDSPTLKVLQMKGDVTQKIREAAPNELVSQLMCLSKLPELQSLTLSEFPTFEVKHYQALAHIPKLDSLTLLRCGYNSDWTNLVRQLPKLTKATISGNWNDGESYTWSRPP